VSVNDEIVHGIPGSRVLSEGDIVGLDYGVNFEGMITDSAITVEIGGVSKDAHRLVLATEQAMYAGIDQVRAGVHIGDISAAVQERLNQDKLGIIRDLAGHGVGHELHEEPWVPNFGAKGHGPILKAGMTIAIEPMASLGTHEVVWGLDGWTISTDDGSLGAHFEHTVLVTETGFEILTQL
jgi:methionyl aminopeptidase